MTNGSDLQSDFITKSVVDGIATVTISRSERRNAMNQAMWRYMTALFTSFAADPDIRVVVLRGAGGHFCAGADIAEFETVRGDADSARSYEADNSATFAAIRNCPIPTIAAISGICFGGGFGMAAACDLRIASDDAIFSVPAAKLGLAYPVDAMADIVNALGPQMAKYLTYSAARLSATDALRVGFVLDVTDADGLESRVNELARTIAGNAPLSIGASKASIRATLTGDAADIDAAEALGSATFDSHDYAEGRAAFREKRKPGFTGS